MTKEEFIRKYNPYQNLEDESNFTKDLDSLLSSQQGKSAEETKLTLPITIKFPIRAYQNSIIDANNKEVIRQISDYELPGELSIREKREFLEYVCFVFNQHFK